MRKIPGNPNQIIRSPLLLPGLGVFGCIVLFAVLLAVLSPAPPRTIVMATGTPGSAYAAFGEQYRDLLARHGVKVELLETQGAVDNIGRLRDSASGVSVAFVQSGLTDAEHAPELESLGTLFFEPVWIFNRGVLPPTAVALLKDRIFSIGPEGSGTRKLALELISAIGLDVTESSFLALTAE